MDGAPIPGFNLDIVFSQHVNKVKTVLYTGSKWRSFFSLDHLSLKLWARDFFDDRHITIAHELTFPVSQTNFISAICHAPGTNVLLASCLDSTLKVYNDRLVLRSSIPWCNGTVVQMQYNNTTDEVITTGAAGVKLWMSYADVDAFKAEKVVAAADRPIMSNGQAVPWCYGKFQLAREKLTFKLPGLRTQLTASDVSSDTASRSAWCQHIQLIPELQLLFALYKADIYGFNATDGTCLYSWTNLGGQPVVDMAYVPAHRLVLTACMDASIAAWKVGQDKQVAPLRSFGRFAGGVHCMSLTPGKDWLLSASLDGFVVAWNLETFTPVFRMKFGSAVQGLLFYEQDRFLCRAGNEVKLFTICHMYEPWMDLSSPVVRLQTLSFGLLLATCADSSIRVLDSSSSASDKSVITTVPQLSTASLVAVACSLTAGRLFVLLSNSHVHVWELHLMRPPSFLEAWTHLSKDKCCSIAFLDGGALQPGVAKHLGLSMRTADGRAAGSSSGVLSQHGYIIQGDDHVVLGCKSGEVVVCDANRGGMVVLKFPVFRLQPILYIVVDVDRNRLATAGPCQLKLWDLATLTCVQEYDMNMKHKIVATDSLEGRLYLGTSSGHVFVCDMVGGAVHHSGHDGDHDTAIAGMAASVYLQHFVTCSRDGYIKVFDRDKGLKASMCLAQPVLAACYLDDQGTLLASIGKRLVSIAPAKYSVTARYKAGHETIYDDLRGTGTTPRSLLRTLACDLQGLGTATVPWDRYSSSGGAESESPRPLMTATACRPPVDLDHSRTRASVLRKTTVRAVARQNTMSDAVKQSRMGKLVLPQPEAGISSGQGAHTGSNAVAVEGSSRQQHGATADNVSIQKSKSLDVAGRGAGMKRLSLPRALSSKQAVAEDSEANTGIAANNGTYRDASGGTDARTAAGQAAGPEAPAGRAATPNRGPPTLIRTATAATSMLQLLHPLAAVAAASAAGDDADVDVPYSPTIEFNIDGGAAADDDVAGGSAVAAATPTVIVRQSEGGGGGALQPSCTEAHVAWPFAFTAESGAAAAAAVHSTMTFEWLSGCDDPAAGDSALGAIPRTVTFASQDLARLTAEAAAVGGAATMPPQDVAAGRSMPGLLGAMSQSFASWQGGAVASLNAVISNGITDADYTASGMIGSTIYKSRSTRRTSRTLKTQSPFQTKFECNLKDLQQQHRKAAVKRSLKAKAGVAGPGYSTTSDSGPGSSSSSSEHESASGSCSSSCSSDEDNHDLMMSSMMRVGQLRINMTDYSRNSPLQHDDHDSVAASSNSSDVINLKSRTMGLQPLLRKAVAVISDPDAFLEGHMPDAEVSQQGGPKGLKKKKTKCKSMLVNATADAVSGGSSQHTSKKKTSKKSKDKRKGGKKTGKSSLSGPVYLSALDKLAKTAIDEAVVFAVKEAEAHDFRQQAAMRQWLPSINKPAAHSSRSQAALF